MSRTLRSGLYIAAAVVAFGTSPALAQAGGPPDKPKPTENRPPAPRPAERPTLNRRPQPEAPKPKPAPTPAPAPPKEQTMLLPHEAAEA